MVRYRSGPCPTVVCCIRLNFHNLELTLMDERAMRQILKDLGVCSDVSLESNIVQVTTRRDGSKFVISTCCGQESTVLPLQSTPLSS
jgi:hypothetical protein